MNLMIFEKLIDCKDRKKIRKRTRDYGQAYDYRLHFGEEYEKDALNFLVVGDSGAGEKEKPMKYHVANEMSKEAGIDLIVHVGDMVYLSGAKQGYKKRFIKTYQHWLVIKEKQNYKNMTFNKPFLPIYGNHDYYDFRKAIPGLGHLIGLFSKSIGSGSKNGKVFEKAFIEKDNDKLKDGKLHYQPGVDTRIPNRYYWYTIGPCAFFALDSNTLDAVKEPSAEHADVLKKELIKIKDQIEKGRKGMEHYHNLEKEGKLTESLKKSYMDFFEELVEIEKRAAMLKKRLDANAKDHDVQQLEWLNKVLQDEAVAGKWKIVYLHHSLYSSEAGHTGDVSTGGLRDNLRKIFVEHKVNLVLSGHSHCFEWPLKMPTAGNPERNICYIVTGGGGQNLRDSILEESREKESVRKKQELFLNEAESKAYTATFKKEEIKKEECTNIHNFLRIEAKRDSLRIIPIGVTENGDDSERLSEFYTKVMTPDSDEIKMEVKKLKAIKVYREKPPEAEWHD